MQLNSPIERVETAQLSLIVVGHACLRAAGEQAGVVEQKSIELMLIH